MQTEFIHIEKFSEKKPHIPIRASAALNCDHWEFHSASQQNHECLVPLNHMLFSKCSLMLHNTSLFLSLLS